MQASEGAVQGRGGDLVPAGGLEQLEAPRRIDVRLEGTTHSARLLCGIGGCAAKGQRRQARSRLGAEGAPRQRGLGLAQHYREPQRRAAHEHQRERESAQHGERRDENERRFRDCSPPGLSAISVSLDY